MHMVLIMYLIHIATNNDSHVISSTAGIVRTIQTIKNLIIMNLFTSLKDYTTQMRRLRGTKSHEYK